MRRATGVPALVGAICAISAIAFTGCSLPFVSQPVQTHSPAKGTIYYINNHPGSGCRDAGAGAGTSPRVPWCDFTPADNHTFQPGDRILLARGDVWGQELTLRGMGAPDRLISLGAYGSGPRPAILRHGLESARAVRLIDPSYWSIADLEIGDAGAGILVFFTTYGHEYLRFSGLYLHDIRGIHQGDTASARSDRIWNSSGIVFTGSVPFSTTQYAVRDVDLDGIEGAFNQDTIAFDWFNSFSRGINGADCAKSCLAPNMVQDVTIENIYLHDDDGPALGCDEGLRLDDMTNVRISDSILIHVAGCYSATGTTGVIFLAVHHALLANSLILDVPDTGSSDESGIDIERDDTDIEIADCYISGNAGAGIEVLAIHGTSDPASSVTITNNALIENDQAPLPNPGGAVARGGNDTVPTGTISGNVYVDPIGFTGGDFQGVTFGQNTELAAPTSVYDAADQFDRAQGTNGWTYQFSADGVTWSDLSFNAPYDAWVAPASAGTDLAALAISQFAERPSSSCSQCRVARSWVAPAAGSVVIEGRALVTATTDAATGSTVRVTDNGATIWAPKLVRASNWDGMSFEIGPISVSQGDVLRFEDAAPSKGAPAWISLAPIIAYLPASPSR